MGKLQYLSHKLKTMSFDNLKEIIAKIHKKTGKNRLAIFMDISFSALFYQAGYMDYYEFEFYLLNKKQRKTYITCGMNKQLVTKYNKRESWYLVDDKLVFNDLFQDLIRRDYMCLKKDNYDDFLEFTLKHSLIIVKPLDDYAGNGISIIDTTTFNKKELFKRLLKEKTYLIEEVLKQHPALNRLYPKSVNTMRMITFFDGKEAYILKVILKCGNGGVIDNFSAGGMYTFVENGIVKYPAIDKNGDIHEEHPITKIPFVGFEVPFYQEAVDLIKEACKRVSDLQYLGWDVAITEEGPAIIEANYSSGVFQVKPSLDEKKEGEYPNYAKYMDFD